MRLFVGSVIIDVVVAAVLLLLNRLGLVDGGTALVILGVSVGGTLGPITALGVDRIGQFWRSRDDRR
jgi:hypothetical protein